MPGIAHFQSLHLLLAFLFLGLWRLKSRRAWLKRARAIFRPFFGHLFVGIFQWWALLALLLVYQLGSSLNAVDKTFEGVDFLLGSGHHSEHAVWLAPLSHGVFPAAWVTLTLILVNVLRQLHAAANDTLNGYQWHQGYPWVMQWSRDVAVQVILMPAVYHICMCTTISRHWAVVTGRHTAAVAGITLEANAHILNEIEDTMAHASLAVAEMYDAYALWCFGSLGMLVVAHQFRRIERNKRNSSTRRG